MTPCGVGWSLSSWWMNGWQCETKLNWIASWLPDRFVPRETEGCYCATWGGICPLGEGWVLETQPGSKTDWRLRNPRLILGLQPPQLMTQEEKDAVKPINIFITYLANMTYISDLLSLLPRVFQFTMEIFSRIYNMYRFFCLCNKILTMLREIMVTQCASRSMHELVSTMLCRVTHKILKSMLCVNN